MSAWVELACVPPDKAAQLWPHISHYIARAMERGGMARFADVEADVLDARALLWLAHEGSDILAAAVTQVTADRDGKLCTIVACGGHDWQRWGFLIEGIEKYARVEQCRAIEVCGRPGWVRHLPEYRLRKIVIRKELA